MDILNINAVIFILYFITPGVMATRVHDLIVPSEQRDWGKLSFDFVSYSAINLFFFYLLTLTHLLDFLPVMNVPLLVSNRVMDFRPVLFVSFLIPITIGFLSGVIPKSVWLHRLLGGVMLNPEPSPWDFLFSDKKRCYGILFHLKSGSKIGGIYGSESYVSTFPHPKEIYVQSVCNIDENGKLLSIREKSAGMFISMDEVSLIELVDIPSKQRSSTWQKIIKWLSGVSSRLSRRHNKRLPKKEKDEGPLQNLTLVSSQSGEAELSHSSLQTQSTRQETEPQTLPSKMQITKVAVVQTPLPQTQTTRENRTAS
jgi:Family of unknown function (DUF6338)